MIVSTKTSFLNCVVCNCFYNIMKHLRHIIARAAAIWTQWGVRDIRCSKLYTKQNHTTINVSLVQSVRYFPPIICQTEIVFSSFSFRPRLFRHFCVNIVRTMFSCGATWLKSSTFTALWYIRYHSAAQLNVGLKNRRSRVRGRIIHKTFLAWYTSCFISCRSVLYWHNSKCFG